MKTKPDRRRAKRKCPARTAVIKLISQNPRKFQKLLNLIRVSLILSALSGIVSCIDIRESYILGRAGTFVISAASLGLGIWLYLEVMHLKSWARKTFIVYTFLYAALFLFGMQAGGNDNLVVTGLDVAGLLIDFYCTYLLFTKDVVAVFKPDSELNNVRAIVHIIHCIGYWLAFGLIFLVTIVWERVHNGTEDWEKDCLAAAVAGSSSAREDLITHEANQSEDQDIEDIIEYVDECIRAQSPKSRSTDVRPAAPRSTRTHVPATMIHWIGAVLIALIGYFEAKFKKK